MKRSEVAGAEPRRGGSTAGRAQHLPEGLGEAEARIRGPGLRFAQEPALAVADTRPRAGGPAIDAQEQRWGRAVHKSTLRPNCATGKAPGKPPARKGDGSRAVRLN